MVEAHCQAIQALGGYRSLARELQLDPVVVWRWQHRGIPAARWTRLVELATERQVEGVTLELLAERYSDAS